MPKNDTTVTVELQASSKQIEAVFDLTAKAAQKLGGQLSAAFKIDNQSTVKALGDVNSYLKTSSDSAKTLKTAFAGISNLKTSATLDTISKSLLSVKTNAEAASKAMGGIRFLVGDTNRNIKSVITQLENLEKVAQRLNNQKINIQTSANNSPSSKGTNAVSSTNKPQTTQVKENATEMAKSVSYAMSKVETFTAASSLKASQSLNNLGRTFGETSKGFENTAKQIFSPTGALGSITFGSKKTAVEFGNAVESILGNSKKIKNADILGDANSSSRNLKDRQDRAAFAARTPINRNGSEDVNRTKAEYNKILKEQADLDSKIQAKRDGKLLAPKTKAPQAAFSQQGTDAGKNFSTAFSGSVNDVATKIDSIAKETSGRFSRIFTANFLADALYNSLAGLIKGLKDTAFETVTYAARTQELGVVLTSLAKVNNISTSSILEQEVAVKRLNITTQDTRETLARFINVGFDVTKAGPLSRVAQDLAVIGNRSTSEELNQLTIAIQTLQSRNLRSAGVFLTVDQILDSLAATTGRARDSFSTLEKQEAVLNATIEYGAKVAGTYDAAMETVSKRMRSLERLFYEAQNAIGEAFVPSLGLAVDGTSALLNLIIKFPGFFINATESAIALGVALLALKTNVISGGLSLLKTVGVGLLDVANVIKGVETSTVIALKAQNAEKIKQLELDRASLVASRQKEFGAYKKAQNVDALYRTTEDKKTIASVKNKSSKIKSLDNEIANVGVASTEENLSNALGKVAVTVGVLAAVYTAISAVNSAIHQLYTLQPIDLSLNTKLSNDLLKNEQDTNDLIRLQKGDFKDVNDLKIKELGIIDNLSLSSKARLNIDQSRIGQQEYLVELANTQLSTALEQSKLEIKRRQEEEKGKASTQVKYAFYNTNETANELENLRQAQKNYDELAKNSGINSSKDVGSEAKATNYLGGFFSYVSRNLKFKTLGEQSLEESRHRGGLGSQLNFLASEENRGNLIEATKKHEEALVQRNKAIEDFVKVQELAGNVSLSTGAEIQKAFTDSKTGIQLTNTELEETVNKIHDIRKAAFEKIRVQVEIIAGDPVEKTFSNVAEAFNKQRDVSVKKIDSDFEEYNKKGGIYEGLHNNDPITFLKRKNASIQLADINRLTGSEGKQTLGQLESAISASILVSNNNGEQTNARKLLTDELGKLSKDPKNEAFLKALSGVKDITQAEKESKEALEEYLHGKEADNKNFDILKLIQKDVGEQGRIYSANKFEGQIQGIQSLGFEVGQTNEEIQKAQDTLYALYKTDPTKAIENADIFTRAQQRLKAVKDAKLGLEDAKNPNLELQRINAETNLVQEKQKLNQILNPNADLKRIADEVELVQRKEKIEESVKNFKNQQRDIEDEISVLKRTTVIPLVETELILQKQILESYQERRAAEQKLTVDIALEINKRTKHSISSTGEINRIVGETFLSNLQDERSSQESLIKNIASQEYYKGNTQIFTDNPAIKEAVKQSQVLEEVQKLGGIQVLVGNRTNEILTNDVTGGLSAITASNGANLEELKNISKGLEDFSKENITALLERASNSGQFGVDLAPKGNLGGSVTTRLANTTGITTRSENYSFVTAQTAQAVKTIGQTVSEKLNKTLSIGEAGKYGGGNYGPHTGHAGGDSFDVRPFSKSGTGPTTVGDKNYDQDATRKAIQIIKAKYPNSTILFNDKQLISEGLTKYYKGHNNHYHVKLRGNEDDARATSSKVISKIRADEKVKTEELNTAKVGSTKYKDLLEKYQAATNEANEATAAYFEKIANSITKSSLPIGEYKKDVLDAANEVVNSLSELENDIKNNVSKFRVNVRTRIRAKEFIDIRDEFSRKASDLNNFENNRNNANILGELGVLRELKITGSQAQIDVAGKARINKLKEEQGIITETLNLEEETRFRRVQNYKYLEDIQDKFNNKVKSQSLALQDREEELQLKITESRSKTSLFTLNIIKEEKLARAEARQTVEDQIKADRRYTDTYLGTSQQRLDFERQALSERLKAHNDTLDQITKLEIDTANAREGLEDRLRLKQAQIENAKSKEFEANITRQLELEEAFKRKSDPYDSDLFRNGALENITGRMKTQTELITGVFNDSFDGISTGFGGLIDKMTGKLGTFGPAVGNLLKGVFNNILGTIQKNILDKLSPANSTIAAITGAATSSVGGSSDTGESSGVVSDVLDQSAGNIANANGTAASSIYQLASAAGAAAQALLTIAGQVGVTGSAIINKMQGGGGGGASIGGGGGGIGNLSSILSSVGSGNAGIGSALSGLHTGSFSGISNPFGGTVSVGNTGSFSGKPIGSANTLSQGGGSLLDTVKNAATQGIFTNPAKRAATQAGANVGKGGIGSLLKGLNLKGVGASLLSSLPSLGASLGQTLGGQSQIGQGLGGIGGLIGGGVGLGVIGAIAGSAGLGGIFGTGGALAAFGGLSAATLGIGAAVAGAFLIGSYLFGRAKRRKEEKKKVTQLAGDAKKQLEDLLKGVRADKIEGPEALSRAEEIRKSYVEQVATLKTGPGKKLAQQQLSSFDAIITQIKSAAAGQKRRREVFDSIVPTYATGGQSDTQLIRVSRGETLYSPDMLPHMQGAFRHAGIPGLSNNNNRYTRSGFGKVTIPGTFDGRDDIMLNVQKNTVIANPRQEETIRSRGYASGGIVGSIPAAQNVSYNSPDVNVVVVVSEEEANKIAGRIQGSIIVQKVINHVKKTGRAGLAGIIENQLNY